MLELTDDVYAELGANCRERRDNRKSIQRGVERIQHIDECYVLLEFLAGQAGEPDCLRVIRRWRRMMIAHDEDFSDQPSQGS